MLAVAKPATNKIAIQRTDTRKKRSHMIPPTPPWMIDKTNIVFSPQAEEKSPR
jgi:hypothetical protein